MYLIYIIIATKCNKWSQTKKLMQTILYTSHITQLLTYRSRWKCCRCIMTVWTFTIRMRWFLKPHTTHTSSSLVSISIQCNIHLQLMDITG